MKPVLLVIAGPNGAGKTTITTRLRSERWSEGVEYLNPDEIARDRFREAPARSHPQRLVVLTVVEGRRRLRR